MNNTKLIIYQFNLINTFGVENVDRKYTDVLPDGARLATVANVL